MPSQLHALMRDYALSCGIPTAEAYRRAIRWAARQQAWGLIVDSGPTVRFDLVLTPALAAELARRTRRGDRASRVVAQAASAWVLHHRPPAWLETEAAVISGLPAASRAVPPVLQLRELLGSGDPVPCAALAAHLGISWARAYGLLQTASRLGDLEVVVVEGEVVARQVAAC